MEQVDEQSYQRYFILGEGKGWFKASMAQSHLDIEFEMERLSDLRHLVARLRRMFDLDADLISIEAHLEQLAPGLVRRTGIRIPGMECMEAGARSARSTSFSQSRNWTIELVSLHAGGERRVNTLFPNPRTSANERLKLLRMPERRKETLKRLADYVRLHPMDSPMAWLSLSGIGPWTVDYAQLRGESRSHFF